MMVVAVCDGYDGDGTDDGHHHECGAGDDCDDDDDDYCGPVDDHCVNDHDVGETDDGHCYCDGDNSGVINDNCSDDESLLVFMMVVILNVSTMFSKHGDTESVNKVFSK